MRACGSGAFPGSYFSKACSWFWCSLLDFMDSDDLYLWFYPCWNNCWDSEVPAMTFWSVSILILSILAVGCFVMDIIERRKRR